MFRKKIHLLQFQSVFLAFSNVLWDSEQTKILSTWCILSMAIANWNQSRPAVSLYPLQPRGLQRLWWQAYAYTTVVGILLLTIVGLGSLFLYEQVLKWARVCRQNSTYPVRASLERRKSLG
jgi:hypothetical protein